MTNIKELIGYLEDMDNDPISVDRNTRIPYGADRLNPYAINRKIGLIARIFKEITKEPKDMEYLSTGRTYDEEITRLVDIIYRWHKDHTTLILALKKLIKDIPYNFTHETSFVEYQRIFVDNEYSAWEDKLKELIV